MSTTFELNIPDEPFKHTYDQGKTVTVTYTGPRYMVISVFKEDNIVSTWEQLEDNIEDIDLSSHVSDEKNFYIIDTNDHLLEACFITNRYENEAFTYEETLPTGETYVYPYDENGIFSSIYDYKMPIYDFETKKFGRLQLLRSVFDNDRFWAGVQTTIDNISRDPAIGEHAGANKELTEYLEKLKNLKTDYDGVDHWKIPYPSQPS